LDEELLLKSLLEYLSLIMVVAKVQLARCVLAPVYACVCVMRSNRFVVVALCVCVCVCVCVCSCGYIGRGRRGEEADSCTRLALALVWQAGSLEACVCLKSRTGDSNDDEACNLCKGPVQS
jgi:hypothetical protein